MIYIIIFSILSLCRMMLEDGSSKASDISKYVGATGVEENIDANNQIKMSANAEHTNDNHRTKNKHRTPKKAHSKLGETASISKDITNPVVRMKNDNGWNSQLESMVKGIGEASLIYKWIYNKLSILYSRRYYVGGSFIIIIEFLLGIASLAVTPTNDANNSNSRWVVLVAGVSSLIFAMLNSLTLHLNYADRASECKDAATKFSELNHIIDSNMRLYRKNRQPAKEFITWITKDYNRLLKECPEISPEILIEYKNKFPDSHLRAPEILDDLREVVVNDGVDPDESTGTSTPSSSSSVNNDLATLAKPVDSAHVVSTPSNSDRVSSMAALSITSVPTTLGFETVNSGTTLRNENYARRKAIDAAIAKMKISNNTHTTGGAAETSPMTVKRTTSGSDNATARNATQQKKREFKSEYEANRYFLQYN